MLICLSEELTLTMWIGKMQDFITNFWKWWLADGELMARAIQLIAVIVGCVVIALMISSKKFRKKFF